MSTTDKLPQTLGITGNRPVSMTANQIAQVFGRSVQEVNQDIGVLLQYVPKAYGQINLAGGEYVLGPIAVMALVLGNRYGGDTARYSIAEYVMQAASGNRLCNG